MEIVLDSIYSAAIADLGNSSDISLLTGNSGKILFLGYLYHSTGKASVKRDLERMIEDTIDLILNQDEHQIDFTYGSGVAGFYWVIHHLYQKQLLLEDSRHLKHILTKETENRIYESLKQDFSMSRYDPLYGYIGKSLYFLAKTESKFTRNVIEEVLSTLSKDKVRIDDERITWVDFRHLHAGNDVNNERLVLGDCGQAHGVTGIVSFLCEVLNKFRAKAIRAKALGLLKPAVNWLLSQEIPLERRDLFFFPQSVNLLVADTNPKGYGRLGWCYGDTIIAYALYKVSIALNDDKYRIKADEIVINSCRVPLESSGVTSPNGSRKFNPTLCHGSAGIALIYQKIYPYHPSQEVLNALNSWKKLTADHTKDYIESRGLLSLFDDTKEASDFLYGYSGIGLFLLSDAYSFYGWENCLMLE